MIEMLTSLYSSIMADDSMIKEYFISAGAVLLAIKSITVLTPTKVDDSAMKGLGKVYNIIAKILNVAAMNIGKDKNADDTPS